MVRTRAVGPGEMPHVLYACEIQPDVAVYVTGDVIVGLLQPLPANAEIENGLLKDKLTKREKEYGKLKPTRFVYEGQQVYSRRSAKLLKEM